MDRPSPQNWQKIAAEFEMLGGGNAGVHKIRVTDQPNSSPRQPHNHQGLTRTFVVAGNGKVSLAKEEPPITAPDPAHAQIIALLTDKNASFLEITRLINSEMAKLVMHMQEQSVEPGPKPQRRLKRIASRFNAVQALLKSVEGLASCRQRDDCDIDGPAFQLVVNRVRIWMTEAVQAALGKGSEGKAREIVERWDRMWKEKQEEIRRHLKSMGENSDLPPDPDVNGPKE